MQDKSSLTFSFCGEHEVDARSISQAIYALVEMTTAIAEQEFPDVEIRMGVKAVRPGSLEFDFIATAIPAVQTLLSQENMQYAANLISVIATSFQIKRFLKGKGPKTVNKTPDKLIVYNSENGRMEIPTQAGVYFVDARVDKSVTNIIQAAQASKGVSAIAIESEGRVEISREEFHDCLQPVSIEEMQDAYTVVRHNEILFVRQASFDGELKWRFKGDHNITATVSDTAFLSRIVSGEITMNAKTYIIADVEVTTYLGINGLPSEAKPAYNVVKVHSIHTVGDSQMEFNHESGY